MGEKELRGGVGGMAKSAFRQSLELVAQLGFEKGYKIAISILEKTAEKSPENKQAFLMSA